MKNKLLNKFSFFFKANLINIHHDTQANMGLKTIQFCLFFLQSTKFFYVISMLENPTTTERIKLFFKIA